MDHGCNSKSQLAPSVCLPALLLTFSLLFSTLPPVVLVIYVGKSDGLLCPCHPSDLISSPCSLLKHSTKLLLCYSSYLVTGPNPRGSLTGPEFMTPAVNSYYAKTVHLFSSHVQLNSMFWKMEDSKPEQDFCGLETMWNACSGFIHSFHWSRWICCLISQSLTFLFKLWKSTRGKSLHVTTNMFALPK